MTGLFSLPECGIHSPEETLRTTLAASPILHAPNGLLSPVAVLNSSELAIL
jgi:hypothetical protein